ncbi:MAG: hypothetical protein ACYTFG_08515, partial [Planctomycetota bacterium]
MKDGRGGVGKFVLPEGHPCKGPTSAGEVAAGRDGNLAPLFQERSGEGPMSFTLPAGERSISFRLDGRLTGSFRSLGVDP